MSNNKLKLAKLTALPFIGFVILSYAAALLTTALHLVSGPVRLMGVLGIATGSYIVWFMVEGRRK